MMMSAHNLKLLEVKRSQAITYGYIDLILLISVACMQFFSTICYTLQKIKIYLQQPAYLPSSPLPPHTHPKNDNVAVSHVEYVLKFS